MSGDGARWMPRADADVLLVGDSFTNIYSDPAMGWGDSAGFAEHLSLALGRPLDVLAENGGAAAAVRLSLARGENRARLTGKRLVLYQFAMRDLAGQHWPVVRLPLASAPGPTPTAPAPSGSSEIEIEGTIVQISRVPDPATAPYASSIGMTRIQVDRVLGGAFDGRGTRGRINGDAGSDASAGGALHPWRPRAAAPRAVQPRGPGHPQSAAVG